MPDIKLLARPAPATFLKAPIPDGVSLAAYQSENTIRNAGNNAWTKVTGLLSIWILSMCSLLDSTRHYLDYEVAPQCSPGFAHLVDRDRQSFCSLFMDGEFI